LEPLKEHIKSLRKDYDSSELLRENLDDNPIVQFEHWLSHAYVNGVNEPIAMTLSTCGPDHRPSSRVVLMRGFDDCGFRWYTNYNSRKAAELEANPFASLNFYWYTLDRQVRIDGKVEKLDAASSDEYFQTRPRESQLGAWASQQSSPLENREELLQRIEDLGRQYEGKEIPRPPFWGGYCLTPDYFEFWQGRTSRLHDRFCYRLESGKWEINRLYP
jgi:pyridoxamine 5'-phosphate oxidase